MYPVSDVFRQAVKANTRKYYWTGRITAKDGVSYDFGQQDIVKGSGYISYQCCENSEITIGGVYAAEAGLSLITEIDRYTLLDASLTLGFHLLLADGTYEEVPMGIFFVSEADRHVKAIDLKCYDAMLKFDKGFSAFGTSGNAYDFMTLASANCGVALAQERAEIEAMANGAVTLGIAEDNDIETYRDLLYYVAQVLGGFFTIDREGKLELRKFGASPVLAVEQAHRFSSSISDFVSSYTAISSTNLKTQVAEYYALEHDTGLTMNLGVNPLMQLGTEDARKLICGNILNDVAAINYVPFDTETIGNPALDLGDVLTFRGEQADENKTGVVTFIRMKIGGKQTLKGVEKKLVSLAFAASEKAESAQFFAQAIITVADTVPVVKSTAAAGTIHIPGTDAGGEEASDIEVSLPVAYELPGEAAVTFRFVVNGEAVLMHQPAETWQEGRHTALLYWPLLKLTANQQNRVELYAKISGGSGSIGMQGLVATVAGQSLAGAGWDGTVSIEESMKAPVLVQGFLHAGTFQDRFVSGELT